MPSEKRKSAKSKSKLVTKKTKVVTTTGTGYPPPPVGLKGGRSNSQYRPIFDSKQPWSINSVKVEKTSKFLVKNPSKKKRSKPKTNTSSSSTTPLTSPPIMQNFSIISEVFSFEHIFVLKFFLSKQRSQRFL